MSLLNELQILERLAHPDANKRLLITPLIAPEEQLGPSSLDLRLGTEFQVPQRTRAGVVAPVMGEALLHPPQLPMTMVKTSLEEPFVLHPGEFALACTLEFVQIPLDLAARLEGRSTWGRLGLQIHATAGFVDPGFKGALTFELSNVSTMPLTLYPGVRIAQICFFQSEETHLPYSLKRYTKYSGQPGAKASSFLQDPEYERIRQHLAGAGAS
jgi:dCTP deaminase